MICASVYLLVFIRNLLVHLAEKILLFQPLTFGGDYRLKYRVGMHFHHSFLLRCLQEPNYSCQVPSRVGRKGKTRETKWHAAN
jgi:hypothetical protein